MTTIIVDNNSEQAQSFIEFARTLPFVKSIETSPVKPSADIDMAAAECNATTLDAFFDELDNRIKKRFSNV
jgi:hypothetical protein